MFHSGSIRISRNDRRTHAGGEVHAGVAVTTPSIGQGSWPATVEQLTTDNMVPVPRSTLAGLNTQF